MKEIILKLEVKELRKKDHKKAVQYAIVGMHFDMYFAHRLELKLYGRYFWYVELINATRVIAAYTGDELAGVLLADIRNEEKLYRSFWRSSYVKIFEWIQRVFFKNSAGIYDGVNKRMLRNYKKKYNPDGEIRFLAVNPDIKVKGTGTKLLYEFEAKTKGKEIYLFTDDQCTYQFYEHRGFERAKEEDIELELNKGKMPLKCLLYRKRIG